MAVEHVSKLPAAFTSYLQKALFTEELSADAVVDVVIVLDDTDLNLRGFGRFLQLLDRSYGRLVVGDLRRYAWDDDAQIRVSQIQDS